jgi:hypothetical protein
MSTELDAVANLFRVLAEIDFRGASPLYERLAREAADDPEMLSLLLSAGRRDRLPHLLFAAVHYMLLGEGSDPLDAFGPEPFATFRSWCLERRPEIEQIVATHVIQTNEVARCAALLPCLGAVAESVRKPLAVLEVGASAGLNLLFDRYRYAYGAEFETGMADSQVVLRPRIQGRPVPSFAMPEVAWRKGLDRLPVDIMDDDAVRWLRACVWPEQRSRTELLLRAVSAARTSPPAVVPGDVIESLAAVVRSAPEAAALCVVHTAFFSYLPDRAAFVALLRELAGDRPLWWVSGEANGLVRELPAPPAPTDKLSFLYGIVPLGTSSAHQAPRAIALAGPHGAWLEWLGSSTLL